MKKFTKDPNATLDYSFDWGDWLEDSDAILSVDLAVSSDDIAIESSDNSQSAVTVWISGGTVNKTYEVTCSIETNEGRKDDRTIQLYILER